VYLNHRKIAGILIENSLQGAVIKQSIIGIGVNINQETFSAPKAVSLKNITGTNYDLEQVVQDLLLHLENRYQQLLSGFFTDLWFQYHEFMYRKNEVTTFLTVTDKFEGIPKGIDHAGRLQVLVGTEVKSFNVKEIAWK
jgi:BirA family biotin operon repressor/biotin-[acetyl-CoA-carboxylase] ligase